MFSHHLTEHTQINFCWSLCKACQTPKESGCHLLRYCYRILCSNQVMENCSHCFAYCVFTIVFQIPAGAKCFFWTLNLSRLPVGPTQPSNEWVPRGFFPGEYSGQGVKITTYIYLVTILRTSGVIPPLFQIPAWHSQEQLSTWWCAIPWRNTGTRRRER